MTLEEALSHVAVGGSISQTLWTQKPEGIQPEDGIEYQVQLVITRTTEEAHTIEQRILATRPTVAPV